MKRAQEQAIIDDLEKKMVIIVGPRQAGKTWLARHIAQNFPRHTYLNYDNQQDKDIIINQSWLPTTPLLILDELHKMPQWKNYLKGLFDTKPQNMRLLITGSARLNTFSQVGDSLAGRYFKHHLLPISPAELTQVNELPALDRLLERGGFPEPFLAEDPIDAKRWRTQYINSILSTDVFEVDRIQNINALRLLFEMLRKRVGSPISYQSLAEDLQISPHTVKKYIEILEALYVVFRVTPYYKNIARSIKKEPKLYFFDTGLVSDNDGIKAENLAAVSLYKHALCLQDYQAEPYQLHYVRTKDKKEIDFALVCEDEFKCLIEVKNADNTLSPTLKAFSAKYNIPGIQAVHHLRHETHDGLITCLKLENFLSNLKAFT